MPEILTMTQRCYNIWYPESRMMSSVVGDLKHIPSPVEASTEHSIAGVGMDMRPRGSDFTDNTYLIVMVSETSTSLSGSKPALVR
jgi:hypothetical protein